MYRDKDKQDIISERLVAYFLTLLAVFLRGYIYDTIPLKLLDLLKITIKILIAGKENIK